MDPPDELECTQVLQVSVEETKSDSSKTQVGYLVVGSEHFPVYNGDNQIGRDPKQCSIVLNKKSVSSHHALIEVESGHHLICDLGSSNATRLNGLLLKPHIRYNLTDNSLVQIADMHGTYRIGSEKINELDTSNQDIFEELPSCNAVIPNTHSTSLNFSGDCSIIGSTPMKPLFKHPQVRNGSNTPEHKTVSQNKDTVCRSQADCVSKGDCDNSTTKATIQDLKPTVNIEDSCLDDTLDDSTGCTKKMVSFVIPCSQQEASDTSLQLRYDTDQSVDGSTSETVNANQSCSRDSPHNSPQPSKILSNLEQNPSNISVAECPAVTVPVKLNDSGSTEEDLYDDAVEQDLQQIEKKMIEEELAEIERTLSSEVLEDLQSDNLVEMQPKCSKLLSPQKPNSRAELNNLETINDSQQKDIQKVGDLCVGDALSDYEVHQPAHPHLKEPNTIEKEEDDIHEAKTQAVQPCASVSDSETDDETLYGACTEASSKINNHFEGIHNAKTQAIEIHSAMTQAVHAVTGDTLQNAETKQTIQTACDLRGSEEAENSDNIHNAKTQHIEADPEDHGEELYQAGTELPQSEGNEKLEDIHDAKTQAVHFGNSASDSDTDDEAVYGACTEAPTETQGQGDNIHNAKTQHIGADPEDHDEELYQAGTEVPQSEGNKKLEDIHDAKTQAVHFGTSASDSDTDDEAVYGACTEAPTKTQGHGNNIHNAKTQHIGADPEDHDEELYQIGTELPQSEGNQKVQDIHDAKTQAVHFATSASDSETDDEAVYGASTEAPTKTQGYGDNIHNAKTQHIGADPEDHDEELYQAGTELPQSEGNKKLQDIHDARTQAVHFATPTSDSETDDEAVYGACTEVPTKTLHDGDDIHNAKTQAIESLPHDTENGDKACSESINSNKKITGDIISGRTHGANARENLQTLECKQDKNIGNIQTAKTQQAVNVSDVKESDKLHGPCSKEFSETIHDAKTQRVGVSVSESEDHIEELYQAGTELPQSEGNQKVQDIHDAKTQAVHFGNSASDSDTDDEAVYGASTEAPTKTHGHDDNIHNAKTQHIGSDPEDHDEELYQAGTELPQSEGNKNLQDIHDAKTQAVHFATPSSDSETDDEAVYGACTEAPTKTLHDGDDIHNAKTQAIESLLHDTENGDKACSENINSNQTITGDIISGTTHGANARENLQTLESKQDKNIENIQTAETQQAVNVIDAKESDEPHGPCSKEFSETIHDAKTQCIGVSVSDPEDHNELPGSEGNEKLEDIHDAKTQAVHFATSASDSDTDDEAVYGACTEAPTKTHSHDDNIHNAKTQHIGADPENHDEELYQAGTELPQSEGNEKLEDIHDAKTQAVHFATPSSDSETDDEAVYGACTEAPTKTHGHGDDIHNAKTQAIESLPHSTESDNEIMYEACTEKMRVNNTVEDDICSDMNCVISTKKEATTDDCIQSENVQDIHTAKTQQVVNVTDLKGSDKPCEPCSEEFPDTIHDANTQIYGKSEVHSSTLDGIHEAKTQILGAGCTSSDADEMACTELPKCQGTLKDFHETKTQSSTLTDAKKLRSRNIQNVATLALSDRNVQEHAAVPKMLHTVPDCSEDLNKLKSLNRSPRKRLSLAGVKKNNENHSALSSCAPQKISTKEADSVKDMNLTELPNPCQTEREIMCSVSDASTQIIPCLSPKEVTEKSEDAQVPETPKSSEIAMSKIEDGPAASAILQDQHSKDPVIAETGSGADVSPLLLKSSNARRGRAARGKKLERASSQPATFSNSENSVPQCKPNSGKSDMLSSVSQDSSNIRKTRATRNSEASKPSTLPRPISPVKKAVAQKAKEIEDDDIFSAATQLLPSSQKDDLFSAATQILPSSSKAEKGVSASHSKTQHSRKSVSFAIDVGKGSNCDDTLLMSQNQSNSNSRKRRNSQRQLSKQNKRLGSSSLEADIEETSSDSSKSADHTIEGSPELSDPHENAVSSAKKSTKSVKSVEACPADLNTNQKSGKKSLSLSRSHKLVNHISENCSVNESSLDHQPNFSISDGIQEDRQSLISALPTELSPSTSKVERGKGGKRHSLRSKGSGHCNLACADTDSNHDTENILKEAKTSTLEDKSGIMTKSFESEEDLSIPSNSSRSSLSSRRRTRESLKVFGKYQRLLKDEDTEGLEISDSSEDGEKRATESENDLHAEKDCNMTRSGRVTKKGTYSQTTSNPVTTSPVDQSVIGSRRTTRGKKQLPECGMKPSSLPSEAIATKTKNLNIMDELKNIKTEPSTVPNEKQFKVVSVSKRKKVSLTCEPQTSPTASEPHITYVSKTTAPSVVVCKETSASAKLPVKQKISTGTVGQSSTSNQSTSTALNQEDLTKIKSLKVGSKSESNAVDNTILSEPSHSTRRSSKRCTRASQQRDASQTSIDSLKSSGSETGLKTSSHIKKRAISESSNDSAVGESRISRSSQPNVLLRESQGSPGRTKRGFRATCSETTSDSQNSDAQKFAAPQNKGRKASRRSSVALPESIISATSTEDVSASAEGSSQTSSSDASTARRSTRNSKESIVNASDSAETMPKASVSSRTRKAGGRGIKKNDVQKVESTVKGIKRLPLQSSGNEPEPKLSRQTTSDLSSVLETSVSSTIGLDDSILSSSLKRGGTLNDSFSSDVGHEVKRKRGRVDSVSSSSNSPRRSARKSMKGDLPSGSMSILFSFYDNSRDESLVQQLGGNVVNNVDAADVLVTDKLRRTVKLLCMVGRGLPIASPSWITLSKKAGKLLDPWDHLLKDPEGELKFGVDLRVSLHRATQKKMLEGYSIYVTSNVKPEPEEMKAIICSCGGEVLNRAPSVWPKLSCVISCNDDKSKWIKMKSKTTVVSAEWLLSGVLRQELNFEANLLV